MHEFDIIKKYFAPLSQSCFEAQGLKDDAAIIPIGDDELVITQDTIIEDVHFLPSDTAHNIAKKLIRVNLSDIAAMGATPAYYMLAMSLPKTINEAWIKEFSDSLKEDMDEFGGALIGGDTTSHNGKITLTLTAIGKTTKNKALKRSTAKEGDVVCVSGTIGDSFLGLQILQDKLDAPKNDADFLKNRYHIPQPRIELAQKIKDIATSCADISDGLISDLSHICTASNVGATINLSDIPLSNEAKNILKKHSNLHEKLLSGGDDYEIIFSINPNDFLLLDEISKILQIKITKIGKITKNSQIILLDDEQKPINIDIKGYNHF